MYINNNTISGRLGADVKMDETKNGTTVGTFQMANTRQYKDASGERAEETSWIRVKGYGKCVEPIEEYLTKGREVVVLGRIRTYDYDKEVGDETIKMYGFELVAESIQLGAAPKGDGDGDDRSSRSSSSRSTSRSSGSRSGGSSKSSAGSRKAAREDFDDVPF